jgi:hypothetical protein
MARYSVGTTIAVLVALIAYLHTARADQPNASESAGTQEPAAQQKAPEPAKKESKITAPEITIKLLSRGMGPRKVLRYKFAAGKKSTMEIVMQNMAQSTEMMGAKQKDVVMPVVGTTTTIENKKVSPDGTLRYEFVLTEAGVIPDPKVPPQAVSAMDSEMKKIISANDDEMKKLIGLNGYVVITNRGIIKDSSVTIPAAAGQHVEQMVNDIRQLAVPLPEEAVGKGAKWEVHMPVNMWSLNSSQVLTYTIEELKGDTGKFVVAFELTTPMQKIDSPNMTAGAELYLEYLKSSGSGTMEFNLTRLVPVSTMKINTSISMNFSVVGQQQSLKSSMNMEMKIESK